MKTKLIVPFLIVLLTANASVWAAGKIQSWTLSGAEAKEVFKQCSRGTPENIQRIWTPTPGQIRTLESLMPMYLFSNKVKSTEEYNFQYAGFEHQGQKLIYINAFPNGTTSNGKQAQIICDGGRSFFGFVYDPESKEFSDIKFNGAA